MADPNCPFDPAHTTPVIPDEQTTDAICLVLKDWDGKNWRAVYQALRNLGRLPDEIEKMTLMDIRMAFATGQRVMINLLGGTLATATHSVATIERPEDVDSPARTWIDPVTHTAYTFDTDHQFEVWSGFANRKYPIELSVLCNIVPRWKEQCAMPETAMAFIKTLRVWWRTKDRNDIAERIKLTRQTVQLGKDN